MKKVYSLLIIIVLTNSCQSQNSKTDRFTYNNSRQEKKDTLIKEPLDSLWQELVFENGGCLSGGQYIKNGRFGNEGCVMSDYKYEGQKWKVFFSYSRKELTDFLLLKFEDTVSTKIHTCPCTPSRNGEVAVYALQKIYKVNWYDLEGFKQYAQIKSSSCVDNEQSKLWEILENSDSRELFINQWKKEDL